MNITELHDRAARLEAELHETRELLARAIHDPGALAGDRKGQSSPLGVRGGDQLRITVPWLDLDGDTTPKYLAGEFDPVPSSKAGQTRRRTITLAIP